MAIPVPTVDEFRALFPKFANASPVVIARAIADALSYVDEVAFGIHAEQAVRYKAAALLESGKYGQSVVAKDGQNPEYEKRFLELRAMVPRKMILT